jgi:cytochrome P450
MGVSLAAIRDHTEHARRRKIWSKGFTSSALREYTPLVVNRTKQLAGVFEEHAVCGEAIDLSKWISYFT